MVRYASVRHLLQRVNLFNFPSATEDLRYLFSDFVSSWPVAVMLMYYSNTPIYAVELFPIIDGWQLI